MLLMIEEVIRGGMCQYVHRYANANNKCMKNYNNKIESSYLTYLDAYVTCIRRHVSIRYKQNINV